MREDQGDPLVDGVDPMVGTSGVSHHSLVVTGLVTYSILFLLLLTIKDPCNEVLFLTNAQHNQGLRQLFLTMSFDLCA